MSNNTLVTAFVNLQKYDGNKRKTVDDYLPRIEELFQYDGHMIIFCEKDMSSKLREIRLRHGKGDLTYISIFDFYHLPFANRLDEMKSMDFFPLGLDKNGKESHEFFVLTWNKIYFLKLALEINPFLSEGFAWIDIGITYVPGILINNINTTLVKLKEIMTSKFDKIKMGCICETSELEISNLQQFYSERRSKLISGFLTLPKDLIVRFNELMDLEIKYCIDRGYFNLEELVMSVISMKYRDIFDLYYGDYEDILRCYLGDMGRLSTIMLNIQYCHKYNMEQLWDLAYIVISNVRDNPNMNLDFIMLNEIYRYLIGNSYNNTTCKKLYEFFLDLDVDSKYLPTNDNPTSEDYLSSLNLDEICDQMLDIDSGIKYCEEMYVPKNLEKSERTMVTMYYDLTKIFGRQYSRQSENHETQNKSYFNRATELMKLNQCIVFVCDIDICKDILIKRTEYGHENKTVILPFEFTESPYYNLKPLIKRCLYSGKAANSIGNSNDRFFHITILPLIFTKMKALEMAKRNNYFGSSCFQLIDFGLFKINQGKHSYNDLEVGLNNISKDKITFPYIFQTAPSEIINRRDFYSNIRWKTVGGFFSIPSEHMDVFLQTWKEELISNLNLLLPASEEQILSCVITRLNDICDNYQADYHDIIENLTGNQTQYHIVMSNLKHCNYHKYYHSFEKLTTSLLEACRVRFNINEKIEILGQLNISADNNDDIEHLLPIIKERRSSIHNLI